MHMRNCVILVYYEQFFFYISEGIAGIQWKKHLLSHVHVTLVDHDDTEKMVANAQANNLTCKEYKLNPLRVPGDLVDKQGEQEVHYCQADAKAAMMMESYNFMLVHHCPIMLLIIFYTVVFGPPPSVLVKNRNMCVTRVVSVLLFCTLLFQIEQELYQNLCVVQYCFILNKSC